MQGSKTFLRADQKDCASRMQTALYFVRETVRATKIILDNALIQAIDSKITKNTLSL